MPRLRGLTAVQVALLAVVILWLAAGQVRAANARGMALAQIDVPPDRSAAPDSSGSGDQLAQQSEGNSTTIEPERTPITYAEPVWISVERMGLGKATITDVGLEPDGTIPVDDSSISWYRYGASASDENGAMILLAHIAYDGEPGRFARLGSLSVGDRIEIGMEGGLTREFEVRSLDLAEKTDFNSRIDDFVDQKSEGLRLYLITCGGSFNGAERSYSSFHIATARAV